MCGEQYYRITLAGLWTGAILYGLYLTLFGASVYALAKWDRSRFYLAVTIALFTFTTIIVLIDFVGMLLTPLIATTSQIRNGGGLPCTKASPAQEREELFNSVLDIIENAISAANMAVADGLLIYRCWILWGYKTWIVAPSASLLIAAAACNMATTGYLGRLYVFDEGIVNSNKPDNIATQSHLTDLANSFSNAGGILSLVVTIVTTGLIGVRIWIMARDVQKMMGSQAGSKYRTAIAIVVESGALWAAVLLSQFVANFLGFDGTTIFTGIMNRILPIAPTLVIVRVGMGQGFETIQDSAHTTDIQNRTHRRVASVHGGTETMSTLHFRTMQGAELEISGITGNGVLNERGRRAADYVRGIV